MKFAEKLKTLRKERGLTQKEFAKQVKIGRSAISMYELGERLPSYAVLKELAKFFNACRRIPCARNTDSRRRCRSPHQQILSPLLPCPRTAPQIPRLSPCQRHPRPRQKSNIIFVDFTKHNRKV